MPLIYLDTSNLFVLEKVAANAPGRFASFLSVWQDKGAELAFSRTHLVEARQHESDAARHSRYAVTAQLAPVRTDLTVRATPREWPVIIQEREVIRALVSKQKLTVTGHQATSWIEQRTTMFPATLSTTDVLPVLCSYDDAMFGAFVKWTRSAVESSATAELRPAGTPYQRLAVKDLPQAPLSAVDVQRGIDEFDKILANDQLLAETLPHLPIEIGRTILSDQSEPLKRMIRRAGEVGIMRAYVETLDVQSDFASDKRKTDEVVELAAFKQTIKHFARESWGKSDDEAEEASRLVDAGDCPGWWLAMQLRLEMRKAEPAQQPSNAYDIDHVMYLPYVDRFFTDKRVAHYLRQILGRNGVPAGLNSVHEPVAVERSIDAIERVIATL